MKKLTLFVEGRTDAIIVEKLLQAARVPSNQVSIVPLHGKLELAKKLSGNGSSDEAVALLVDSDETFIPDALEQTRQAYKDKEVEVFFAIPEIEAWLFADDKLAIKFAKNESARKVLETLPAPDDIPHPKEFFNYISGGIKAHLDNLEQIDISKAASRSPSLRYFLLRVGELLEVPVPAAEEGLPGAYDLQIAANLLKETLPGDTVIFRTSDGSQFTAAEILNSIARHESLGRTYFLDVLRVARDFLKRKANRA